jgi:hypothetical protein
MGGMGAMPGMPGKAGPGGGGGAPPVTMGLTMDGEFVTDFDVKAGMLKALEGTLTVDSGAAGMSMKNHSELQMKRL